jgi:hypothetical protein
VVEVKGLGQSFDGTYKGLPEGEDSNPYSARNFITVSPEEFHLEPGASRDVEVRINVPNDVSEGGRYAITYIRGKYERDDQSRVGFSCAIGVPVVLTIENTELTEAGRITDFSLADEACRTVNITAILKNTGNYHYKAQAQATLRDSSGIRLSAASTPLTTCSIIPDCLREFNLSLTTGEELLPDDWYIDLEILDEDGNVLDTWSTKPENHRLPWIWIGGIIAVCVVSVLFAGFLLKRRVGYRNGS